MLHPPRGYCTRCGTVTAPPETVSTPTAASCTDGSPRLLPPPSCYPCDCQRTVGACTRTGRARSSNSAPAEPVSPYTWGRRSAQPMLSFRPTQPLKLLRTLTPDPLPAGTHQHGRQHDLGEWHHYAAASATIRPRLLSPLRQTHARCGRVHALRACQCTFGVLPVTPDVATPKPAPPAQPARAGSLVILISFVILVLSSAHSTPLFNRWRKRKFMEKTGAQNLSFTHKSRPQQSKSDRPGRPKAA